MSELDHDQLEGSHKYRVIRELGRGGMGEVFLAEHTSLGSKVVVKLLHAELSAKSALVDRMRLEAQALARLNHPNIVRVTDFDRTPSGRPYFVMEFLPGRSLREEVEARGGVLPPLEAIDVCRQALAGLASAHAKGLVHRDIKLDNLFVADEMTDQGPRRTIKILDFGVAKVLDPAADGPAPLVVPTGTGVVVGTPRFFAPEQARGQKLDHRADIYAMGLVLYSLLAGRGPFDEARSIAEMAKAHVLQPPDPPSRFSPQQVPPALDAAVLRAIQKRPEDRFPSAAEFSAELARIAEALSAPATAYGAPAMGYSPAPPASSTTTAPPISASDADTARLAERAAATAPIAPTAPLAAAPAPPLRTTDEPRRYSLGVVTAVLVGALLFGAAVAAVVLRLS